MRGQKKIDPDRARTIQEALIREHYLSGEPTGTWNQASEDAMRRYQSDHGWQTKEVPDSRALISLGLGPSKDHLLNPESAMTTSPPTPAATPPAPMPSAPAPTPAAPPSDSSGPQ
ncbi:MAG TPA: peptidoglycan-binding domain-containing protein [Candidatus Acidoferrales bacterium]|nr:peptidoglycan-binding domain-containing protein [Candidatus Acidoferrales bacterium]